MKVNIMGRDFTRLVRDVSLAIRSDGSMVEKRVTLTAEDIKDGDGLLKARCAGLALDIQGEEEATISQEGSVTLDATILLAVAARVLPDEQVTISRNPPQVVVSCKGVKMRLGTFPESKAIYKERMEAEGHIPAYTLRRVFPEVWYTEENDVLFHMTSKTLVAGSYNNTRIVQSINPLIDGNAERLLSVVLPVESVKVIHKLLPDDEHNVELGWGTNGVTFYCGSRTITTRIKNSVFPDLGMIFSLNFPSQEFHGTAVLDPKVILAALERASYAVDANVNAIYMEVGKNKLRVRNENNPSASFQEEMELVTTGEPVQYRFTYRYLVEAFRAMANRGTVTMCWRYPDPVVPEGELPPAKPKRENPCVKPCLFHDEGFRMSIAPCHEPEKAHAPTSRSEEDTAQA